MKSEQQRFYSPQTQKYRPNAKFTYLTACKASSAYKNSRQTTDTAPEDVRFHPSRVHAIFPSHKPQLTTFDQLISIKIEDPNIDKESIIREKDKEVESDNQLEQIKKLKMQLLDLQEEQKILSQQRKSLKQQHQKTFDSLKAQISTLNTRKQSLQYQLSCLFKDYQFLAQQQ